MEKVEGRKRKKNLKVGEREESDPTKSLIKILKDAKTCFLCLAGVSDFLSLD